MRPGRSFGNSRGSCRRGRCRSQAANASLILAMSFFNTLSLAQHGADLVRLIDSGCERILFKQVLPMSRKK